MRIAVVLFLTLSACSSTPKLPSVDPLCTKLRREILKPGAYGSWAPGLYAVDMGVGHPPVLWCSKTQINWVPKDFEAVKRKSVQDQ